MPSRLASWYKPSRWQFLKAGSYFWQSCGCPMTLSYTPLAHLLYCTLFAPKKFCTTFVFHFSWVLQPFQENLKTRDMQKYFSLFLGGGGGQEGALWEIGLGLGLGFRVRVSWQPIRWEIFVIVMIKNSTHLSYHLTVWQNTVRFSWQSLDCREYVIPPPRIHTTAVIFYLIKHFFHVHCSQQGFHHHSCADCS